MFDQFMEEEQFLDHETKTLITIITMNGSTFSIILPRIKKPIYFRFLMRDS